MKRYLSTIGLIAFTGALFSIQATSIRSYAANSVGTTQDTIPKKDTSKMHKKWKSGKMKGDSTWHKKDSMPQ
jgi:hypothetical protein